MKVSEFLNNSISSFLLGAFYGRYEITKDNKYIYSLSSYKSSKFCTDIDFYNKSKEDYLNLLNEFSRINIWTREKIKGINRAEFLAVLENDLNITAKSFFNRLYTKILSSSFLQNAELTEDKKMFLRGFFELRGSVDTKFEYITQDYFYKTEFESKRVRLLIDLFNVPVECLNYNFRELQKQFLSGENKRNTQLRVYLSWYCKNIGVFNPYKIKIIESACNDYKVINSDSVIKYFDCQERNYNKSTAFEDRIVLYCNAVLGKDLSPLDIERIRKEIGFDKKKTEDKFIRNRKIVDIVKLFTPDLCSCCQDEYDIKDRTFISRVNHRPYLEIHHVISFANNSNLDVEENLVKLCPACHRQLKVGVGLEEEQKKQILKILVHNNKVLEFAKHIYDTEDNQKIIECIYKDLK